MGFKIDDQVECIAFGKGTVKMILNSRLEPITGVAQIDNPVVVEFKNGIKQYTLDGKLEKWGRTTLTSLGKQNNTWGDMENNIHEHLNKP